MSDNIWLVKTEPNEFSIDDLHATGKRGEPWNGIRNFQARNFLRAMSLGDIVLIYHSACKTPAIVGTGKIIKEAYADPEALNPKSKYFDSKSTAQNNRWNLVDVQFTAKWPNPVNLKQLKATEKLSDMKLIKQSRLSVSPVTIDEFNEILTIRRDLV